MLTQLFVNVRITPMVYEELQIPLMYGYAFSDDIFNKAELVTISEEEQKDYQGRRQYPLYLPEEVTYGTDPQFSLQS